MENILTFDIILTNVILYNNIWIYSILFGYEVMMLFTSWMWKGGNTLKELLLFPKDKEEMTKQSNIVHWYKCGRTECDDEYIGESARTFEERYREHLKAP